MCRLLCVQSVSPFEIGEHLSAFAEITKESREYQGHGWGCAWLENDRWQVYRNINPVWDDKTRNLGRTRLLVAHARSAFRDEGISIENNMPFNDDEYVFIFNGELRGVRIKEDGRIGAEKIFNYVRRFDKGDMEKGLSRGVEVIEKRTRYIRAMNIILANPRTTYVSTLFSEDPAYFQLHEKKQGGVRIICSQPYPGESDWQTIENRTTFGFDN